MVNQDCHFITAECRTDDGRTGWMQPMEIPAGLSIQVMKLGLEQLAEVESARRGQTIEVEVVMIMDLTTRKVLYDKYSVNNN